MMTEETRDLAMLVQSGQAVLSPTQASEQEMKEMSTAGENLKVLSVHQSENEQYGINWQTTVERPSGQLRVFGLWANEQRDLTMASLEQLTKDGPVSGVRLANFGSEKKPFYCLTAVGL